MRSRTARGNSHVGWCPCAARRDRRRSDRRGWRSRCHDSSAQRCCGRRYRRQVLATRYPAPAVGLPPSYRLANIALPRRWRRARCCNQRTRKCVACPCALELRAVVATSAAALAPLRRDRRRSDRRGWRSRCHDSSAQRCCGRRYRRQVLAIRYPAPTVGLPPSYRLATMALLRRW